MSAPATYTTKQSYKEAQSFLRGHRLEMLEETEPEHSSITRAWSNDLMLDRALEMTPATHAGAEVRGSRFGYQDL
jgi:hypothetical protein